jgi:diguanylate cyclase (GGDEF)-like protein
MSRARHKLGLMFIDLDGFKLVNDTLGHDKGDDLLREAAVRISSCTRNGDTVARLGGDEFTVIMPNLHDAKDAPLVAQRILDALAKPFDLDGTESFISGSIGITIFPGDASDANNLLKNADAAMYRAKDLGKANFQFFTSDLNEEVAERLTIKNGLIKALERDEFKVFYQPKVMLSTGQVDSVEALMRWDNPDLGMVSPARFIPVLEETGMVVEFGEWAIREACKQHRTWIDAGLPPIRIAVNLSARQLREISFVSVLQKVLHEAGVGPEGIEIEITESMIMSDTDSAIAALTELHGLGVRVAMDDFGTGYSSLSYLRKFPIDTIKIDGSFVADISTSADDAEIVRTIISMGQTLNKTIVAEGVETEEQLQLLRNFKCDQVQGYLFSRPVPGNELTEFIRETNR